MNDEVEHLIQEVTDDLDAGPVGLFEFIYTLRTISSLNEDQMTLIAAEALQRLLSSGQAKLVRQLWGDPTFTEDATGATPTQADWRTPSSGPYLAVAPTCA